MTSDHKQDLFNYFMGSIVVFGLLAMMCGIISDVIGRSVEMPQGTNCDLPHQSGVIQVSNLGLGYCIACDSNQKCITIFSRTNAQVDAIYGNIKCF